MYKMDLHSHTFFSDGSASPQSVVEQASEAKVELLAITDHDCVEGVKMAIKRGNELNVKVLPAIEIDVMGEFNMHLLAYDIDIENEMLNKLLRRQEQRRQLRNEAIVNRLCEQGFEIEVTRAEGGTLLSRSHIASALVKHGFAPNMDVAFKGFLNEGGVANIELLRISVDEYFEVVHQMGAYAVMAHPYKLGGNVEYALKQLKAYGLWGVEAFYPAHTMQQVAEYANYAQKLDLHCTCGSDYHGELRPGVCVGQISDLASECEQIKKAYNILATSKT